ncbi:hypothetical protein BDQ12DRAFT_689356 [Crucibulum laeve]|uniref:Uncharacterized protein n=1 Tax=Crucibulum laeve TaxID=68775 RepID=A0A5C3LNN5_9AGAR|nr:hypothetical protein BDQ12DRAFT_689356 [Crucibulum laeve]
MSSPRAPSSSFPFSLCRIQLLTIFLLFTHLQQQIYALTFSRKLGEYDLGPGCQFELAGREYNFCPLIGPQEVEISVGRNAGRRYEVALGGLEKNEGSSSCPEGTWVCMTERILEGNRDSSPVEWIIPIAGKRHPTTTSTDKGLSIIVSIQEAAVPLNLFLDGGRTYASLDLVCGSQTNGNDKEGLTFMGERNAVHSFRWVTQHACPINVHLPSAKGRFSIAEEHSDNSGEPGGEEEKKEEGDELLPSKPKGIHRRWVAITLLFVGTILLTASILVSSPTARHLILERLHAAGYSLMPLITRVRSVSSSLSPKFPFHFREDEDRLVRWAQEDMTIHDVDEDVMVNGADAWTGDGLDEYIPLKSPTWARKGRVFGGGRNVVRSYGAAELDIDVEDGVVNEPAGRNGTMNKISRIFGRR